MVRALAGLALLLACAAPAAFAAGERSVVDMAGKTVRLPGNVKRIACLEVLCYEKLFLLGASERIVTMTRANPPWMAQTNPAVRAIPQVAAEPNVEELLQLRPDVVFRAAHYPSRGLVARLEAMGIPVLAAQPVGAMPAEGGEEAFVASRKRMLRLYAQVLGGEFEARAEEWCAYLDRKLAYVRERTQNLAPHERVRLYQIRGPAATRTHGPWGWGQPYWYGRLAGAEMVVDRERSLAVGGGFRDVSLEALLQWNPQVINVGRSYSARLVTDDPRWREVAAVRDGRVHELPEGVFYWDGSTEGVLLMLYVAKELYPQRFPDLDLRHEIRDYYARFYRYALSDAELDLFLAGKGPDGRRHNAMNN